MSRDIKLKPQSFGEIELNGLVDITDPCYARDVWCRMNDVKVEPGTYKATAFVGTTYVAYDGKRHRDNRVFVLQICKKDHTTDPEKMVRIGDIGVDAGMAGFFPSPKKDFSDNEWYEFCEKVMHHKQRRPFFAVMDGAAFSDSGYGDGGYDVYAEKNENGECVAIEIRF